MTSEKLFTQLFKAGTEQDVEEIILANSDLFRGDNWHPLGKNPSNYSIVKNQQANPIAALIEKLTNSIDAILTKKCLEAGIDPKSTEAPRSINEAVQKFFGDDSSTWDLDSFRKEQAKEIQIVADGTPRNTSVIIYDNGEGQHPDKFEDTFLSLVSGNKKNIHFVQGKYNMGGSGALVFCGKKRYQLVASKKYDGAGEFGFTLVREHPLSKDEQYDNKETWYEYFMIDGQIPRFQIDELDLKLFDRKFKTGSIIKLYSYQFPSGYSGFAQDLNQSINEYLFRPALPIYTVDNSERYPNNRILELDLFGLQRRLEQPNNNYVEHIHSWDSSNELFGKCRIKAYVFKAKLDKRDAKESKEVIRKRFFKNDMSVLFSLNGQVHGHFTSEFITRSLKLNLLKNHLLIHVDCTKMNYDFRKELFMASRDRLKDGEETKALRKFLATELSKKDSPLSEIEKLRKDSITADAGDTKELLKSFTKNLPMDSELMKLLNQTFKLDLATDKKPKNDKHSKKKKESKEEKHPFNPQRFPTHFNMKAASNNGMKAINIPRGTEKTIQFDTDVENTYFDRIEEPGEMKIALVSYKANETEGGTDKGEPKGVEELFNINKSSPKDGKLRVSLNPKSEVRVGDEIEMKVTLSAPGEDLEELFWAKITEPEAKKETAKKEEEDESLGLPEFVLVYKGEKEGKNVITWDKLEEQSISMGYDTVMYPLGKGDSELERIYINMDSHVFKSFMSKTKHPNEQQIKMAENKYISSVYFHTLFLYTITKNRGYQISKLKENKSEPDLVDVADYLKDVFDHFYSTFILNYGGMEEMMVGIGD
ncbi:MAG: hypothetical protein AAF620_17930 [Bacteroidota bacterium]